MKVLKLDNDEKLRNSYKNIVFNYNQNGPPYKCDIHQDITPTVSFNTVPLILGTSSYEADFDGVQINPLSIPTPVSAPLLSLKKDFKPLKKTFGNLNPLIFQSYNNIDKLFYLTPDGKLVRKDYPSRPTITNDSMVINQYYLDWLQSWRSRRLRIEDRLSYKKSCIFKYPDIVIPSFTPKPIIMKDDYIPLTKSQRKKMTILNSRIPSINSPRTIICHLNGRKHTWVPLDWLLDSGLHELDHLVVLTNIPRMLHKIDSSIKNFKTFYTTNYNNNSNSRNINSINDNNNNNNNASRNFWGDSLVYEKTRILETCYNILTYIYFLLSNRKDTIRIKITIDIVLGKTKKILIDSINLYTPDIIIVPTLKWERNSKLIDIKSNYLKDNLCVNFPIPTIIVPVKRLFQFELNLQQRLNINNLPFQTIKEESSMHTTDLSLSPQSSIVTSNESMSSVDSFAANHCYSEVTNLSNSISPLFDKNDANNNNNNYDYECDNNDWKKADQKQFLSNIQELPITSQLYLVAKRYRKNMHKEIAKLDTNKNCLTRSDYLIRKLDSVVNNSIGGSLMINNLKDYEISDDVDLKGFARLKRVITGGEPICYLSPRPMTDVSAYKSNKLNNRKKVSNNNESCVNKRGASQIIFASDVKVRDGKKALGNLKTEGSSSISGKPIISVTPPERVFINENNNTLRKVYSNDSGKSSRSIKSDNGLYMKKTSLFNSKKKSISTPSSRRNSDSSGKSQSTLTSLSSSSYPSSSWKRNLISKIFGFK
ncbi:uncharacterized protein PWA37_003997 [Arxiozyma heterogenica]|uniref:uncharacterized protein n=1 Tax=Arxiozyma heterogenica TaxID=278026 RepID=UPI002F2497AD